MDKDTWINGEYKIAKYDYRLDGNILIKQETYCVYYRSDRIEKNKEYDTKEEAETACLKHRQR